MGSVDPFSTQNVTRAPWFDQQKGGQDLWHGNGFKQQEFMH